MKTKLILMALVLSLAGARPARATVIFSSGPIGSVEWGTFVPLCKITSGAGLASINISGGITFAGTKSGTINLACEVQADPSAASSVNAFGLTFVNDNGFSGGVDQCLVSTSLGQYPYAGGFPTLIGAFNTSGQVFSGRQTANIATSSLLDINTNLYIVSISLTRSTALTCNPKVVDTFVEVIIP
jgi:hypothetical protein